LTFTFEDLVAVMSRLRGPDGCPWDREQNHASLAPYLLEEAHEVLEAISRGDPHALRDELGDLLLQVVFHAQMAREAGGFDAGEVVDGLVRKLVDRHPHVFGDLRLGTADEVLAHWHAIKRREAPDRRAFEGIPASLPALARAQKLLRRAAENGQTGPDVSRAATAVRRALRQVAPPPGRRGEGQGVHRAKGQRAHRGQRGVTRRGETRPEAPAEAMGDLLLAVVVLAAAAGVDAEAALRRACDRFAAPPEQARSG
jgi:XTP/dITP diphosphohydrolase